jgi:signal peptidase I
LLIAFAFSVYVAVQDNTYFENVPTLKVVNSNSMAKRLSTNKYLYEHDLGNQFYTFDLICVYKTPDQYDLELYDIVVYQQDDIEVVHRIVGIEEPNVEHPNERYFLLQGDAVERPDRFPVHFSQIKAIYRGERIPFVGSFVYFMQSPAGWLCILLVVFAMVSSTLVNKRLTAAKNERLRLMGLLEDNDSDSTPPEDCTPAAQAEEEAALP